MKTMSLVAVFLLAFVGNVTAAQANHEFDADWTMLERGHVDPFSPIVPGPDCGPAKPPVWTGSWYVLYDIRCPEIPRRPERRMLDPRRPWWAPQIDPDNPGCGGPYR